MPQSAERKKSYHIERRLRDGDALRAAAAVWRDQNREYLKEKSEKRRREKRAMCLIAAARVRSRKKGIVFSLDGFAPELQRRLDVGLCELCGLPFDMTPGRTFASPSLDRIKPELGYVPDNVRLVLHVMNAALGNWGEETLSMVIDAWIRTRSIPGQRRRS